MFSRSNKLFLLLRNRHIAYGDGDRSLCGIFEAVGFDIVKHLSGNSRTVFLYRAVNYLAELFFRRRESDLKIEELCRIASVNKSEILRNRLVEYKTTERSIYYSRVNHAVYFF